MTRELALDAVLMAVRRRRPRRILIHSDQGSQYGSDDWRRFRRRNRDEPIGSASHCDQTLSKVQFISGLRWKRMALIYKARVAGGRNPTRKRLRIR